MTLKRWAAMLLTAITISLCVSYFVPTAGWQFHALIGFVLGLIFPLTAD